MLVLACGSPTGCREPRDATHAPQGAVNAPRSSSSSAAGPGMAASGRASPTTAGGEVLATVDDSLTIDQQSVDAWILGASSTGDRLAATPEAQAKAINALIFEHLLRDACAEVCDSGPPSPSRCACDPHTIEKTVTEALLLHPPTEAEIAAEYELQKRAWTSDSPWVAVSLIAVPWLEPIGVPVCDTVMAQAWRCHAVGMSNVVEKVEIARELRRLVAASTPRSRLSEQCKHLRVEYQAAICDWSSTAPIGDASKRIAHGRIPAARAKLAAPADAVPAWRRKIDVDPEWVYAERSITPIDKVPPALRTVVEQAKLGEPSPPVEINRAYWMVLVDERWPAGALPLDARRAEITAAARDHLEQRAHEELPLRLREGHEIVMHRYEIEARTLLVPRTRDSYLGGPNEENAVADVSELFGVE